MSTIEDLKKVLKESLQKKGSLDQIKAKLRADIYSLVEDNDNDEMPKLPQENLFINELFREYLDHNKYRYTKSVFIKESGQPESLLSKDLLITELHLKEIEVNKELPLIYTLLWHFLNNDKYDDKNDSKNRKSAHINEDDIEKSKINIYEYKTDFE